MSIFRIGITILLFALPCFSFGQSTAFDSFISSMEDQYQVDVALAPELIPTLDSIRHLGTDISSIQELLHRLLNDSDISYQLIDGNKLMLRRETAKNAGLTKATIVGQVVNKHTDEPIPFVSVFAPTSNVACTTDDNGNFILPVTDTTGFLEINYLGFKPVRFSIAEAIQSSVNVLMEIDKIPLDKIIIIVPYRLFAQDYSSQSTDIDGYHLISEDQLLQWNSEQLLSNFTNYTHYSSDRGIRIRGVDACNTMIVMDHIPVYDPYHYYNLFSPFNGLYFSSVSVFKNNLPIEYGGRIDGLINAQSTREEVHSKLILDTDLLQSGVTTELALSPTMYFTGGVRISHTAILTPSLSDSSVANFTQPGRFKNEKEWSTSQQPETNFYDVNLGLNVQTGEKGTIGLNYFDSRDQLENLTYTGFATTIMNHEVLSVEQNYSSKDVWENQGVSAFLKQDVGEQTNIQLEAYYSKFDKNVAYESHLKEVRMGETRMLNLTGFQENHLMSSGIKGFTEHDFDRGGKLKGGLAWQNNKVEFAARENKKPFLTQTQSEQSGSLFGAYTDKFWSKLEWELGSRVTYLQSMDKTYFLPNLRLLFPLKSNLNLRASYSKNLQSVRGVTFENRFGRELNYLLLSNPAEGIPVLTSDKYMLGIGYSKPKLSLDVELYYKTMDGLVRVRPLTPDPSDGTPVEPSDFYQLFDGDGRTYGSDVTLIYKNKKVETSLLYTLSWIEERYPMLFQGAYFSPQEDRRHQVKFSGAYEMGSFKVSALLTYKSPSPYLSLVQLEGDGIGDADFAAVQDYLPAYFSLDLSLDYHFNLIKQPAMVGVSLINATNHTNVSDLQYLGRVSGTDGNPVFITNQTELLGRTFNVHFRYLID